jgi:hypothetical protein
MMTNTTTTNKFNPMRAKLHLYINDTMLTYEVVSLWNDYVDEQGRDDEHIWPFTEDKINELLKGWHPSDIIFSLQRTDQRDRWFILNESRSEIISFPEWEADNYINLDELIDWLVKDDKWQEYDELKPAADIELL